jgi:hypothetical protein
MKKSIIVVLILIGIISLVQFGCGGSISLINVWSNPEYHGGKIEKVLVVGLAPRERSRTIFEHQLTNEFNINGVKAMASLDGMPKDEEISKDAFKKYFKDLNLDAVLITGLVRADTSETYVAGSAIAVSSGYYRDFWGYYNHQVTVYRQPGYIKETKEYLIESTLYETTNGKIIWRGISKSVDPEHIIEVIEVLSKNLVKQLIKDDIVLVSESQK